MIQKSLYCKIRLQWLSWYKRLITISYCKKDNRCIPSSIEELCAVYLKKKVLRNFQHFRFKFLMSQWATMMQGMTETIKISYIEVFLHNNKLSFNECISWAAFGALSYKYLVAKVSTSSFQHLFSSLLSPDSSLFSPNLCLF